jgi:NAD(P)-dependent dehydrogenase (short-subunit alcohol dehydrogenase family)
MNNPLDFSRKVALVTGAAAGMGLATARAFAEAGAAVALADFKEEAVKAAAQDLVAAGRSPCVAMSAKTSKGPRWWTAPSTSSARRGVQQCRRHVRGR